jgi:3-deoxy-7-phosphoheptulonate synthase
MDLAAVPVLHDLTHLPVIVDPSHATGKRWLVRPLALGGVAVGADGIMVEVHPDPDSALSDAEQQLDFEAFASLMRDLVPVHEHVRHLHDGREPVPGGRREAGSGDGLSRH